MWTFFIIQDSDLDSSYKPWLEELPFRLPSPEAMFFRSLRPFEAVRLLVRPTSGRAVLLSGADVVAEQRHTLVLGSHPSRMLN
jgi:hypothetical protein